MRPVYRLLLLRGSVRPLSGSAQTVQECYAEDVFFGIIQFATAIGHRREGRVSAQGANRRGESVRSPFIRVPGSHSSNRPRPSYQLPFEYVRRRFGPTVSRSGVTGVCAACGMDRDCISRRLCQAGSRLFRFCPCPCLSVRLKRSGFAITFAPSCEPPTPGWLRFFPRSFDCPIFA
jgi:hypothetical protein